MQPSEEDIANFLAFAAGADEGKAFVFLEGAGSVDEAVQQYYENPERYSQSQGQSRAAPAPAPAPAPMSGKGMGMGMGNMNGNGNGTGKGMSMGMGDVKQSQPVYQPPPYAPPNGPAPTAYRQQYRPYTNAVIEAGIVRARDEQEMQNLLQTVQMRNGIYNPDIEPEHEIDGYCGCDIHRYKWRKQARLPVQNMWSKAVMYPGEKAYNDCYQTTIFSSNPYRWRVTSPYGYGIGGGNWGWGIQRPSPGYHAQSVQQTISLNAQLNAEAQRDIDAREPRVNIWGLDQQQGGKVEEAMGNFTIDDDDDDDEEEEQGNEKKGLDVKGGDEKKKRHSMLPGSSEKHTTTFEKRQSISGPMTSASSNSNGQSSKPSKFAAFKKALSIKTPEEKAAARTVKANTKGRDLRNAILSEEQGRWPDQEWRNIVYAYQEHVGMGKKIAELRTRYPLQYLHLLRAGYFEPIPVAWADQASNPLKFSIEAAAGWRGITPSWRGYEDTAEERLYWVLNHREGTTGTRLKPDFISAMNLARQRMASAVPPPPAYFSPNDTCHLQHTSEGYSNQVMPPPFRAYDAPETANDDTMILLDVSGSMDFDPLRPNYNQYLITGYSHSTQPKNKDVAKAIIRRFTDAMTNHDHNFSGYDLTTFSTHASHIGTVSHRNLDAMWSRIRIGGGTRVMTGWQKVKQLHFEKHRDSATHHPVYGWQAGPNTPILRLLLLLDGEATDMDEFELDLLASPWVHVTIFLIGVDGCPHHHRHANELQRISEVNHHVSFVDAQGNTPERFVTHELLKRHLGYEISMREFEELEVPPPYDG